MPLEKMIHDEQVESAVDSENGLDSREFSLGILSGTVSKLLGTDGCLIRS
jgi:hypothetical protein